MAPFGTLINAAREFIAERQETLENDTHQRYTFEDRASVEREQDAIETEIAALTRLLAVTCAIADMKSPSIEHLLRRRGYGYEADRVAELVQTVTSLCPQK